jgi:alkylhydroperoxidase/carboxymuconolactone decarboxylase family protein YurZ
MKMELPNWPSRFRKSYPDAWKAFQQLGQKCHEAGPLDECTRRLIKIGIAVAAQSEGAVHSAVRQARAAGVSSSAIRHAVLLSMTTIGFPRTMAALSWAEDVLAAKSHSLRSTQRRRNT